MNKKGIFKLITAGYFLICLIEFPLKLFNNKYIIIIGLILIAIILVKGMQLAYTTRKFKYLLPRSLFLLNYVCGSYVLLYLFPNVNFGIKSVIIAIFSMFLYLLLLSVNVYIVSDLYKEVIPLLQPSRLIVFMASILNIFLTLSFIYKIPLFYDSSFYNLLVKIILIIGYIILYFYFLDWYIKTEVGKLTRHEMDDIKELKLHAVSSMIILAIILMFVPFESFGRALILSAYMYCVLGFIQSFISRRVHTGFLITTIVIMSGTYLLVSFL